jgi:hypothetical protein
LREALDWVQRSSVAADNNRIYADGLVTSRQRHFSVASFNFVENFQSEGLGSEVVPMVQTAEPRHDGNSTACTRILCCHPACRSFFL